MATLSELEAAFIKADDAGNTEDAQAFADEIKRLRVTEKPVSTRANALGAVAEPIMNMLSGMVAKPVSDIAGLAATGYEALTGAGGDPAGFKRHVQESLTYSPRTQAGKAVTESDYNPVNVIGNVVGSAARGAGDIVKGDNPGPLQTAAGDFVQEAIPQAVGLVGAGAIKTPSLPKFVTNNSITKGIEHLTESVPTRAGRFANEAFGNQKAQAIALARQKIQDLVPGSTPTFAEITSSLGRAEPAALEQLAGSRYMPSEYRAKNVARNESYGAALDTIGGTPKSLGNAIDRRGKNYSQNFDKVKNDLINPASERQIWNQEIAGRTASKGEALRDWGRFATGAAENETMGANFHPVPGMPRVSGRVSNFPDRVAEYTSAATDAKAIAQKRLLEESYLTNAMESLQNMKGIDDVSFGNLASRPSIKKAVQDALESSMESGTYFPAAPGERFSVQNLQRIKKALDENISQKLTTGVKPKDASIAEIESTRNLFIDWLGKKSPGWNDARAQFARESVPINQMQVGQYLKDKLVPAINDEGANMGLRRTTFTNSVADAPATIKRATGAPMYTDLRQIFNEPQMQTVQSISADLGRRANTEGLAASGRESMARIIGSSVDELPLPPTLKTPVMAAKFAIRKIASGKSDKAIQLLAKEMLDNPAGVANLMEKATPKQRQALIPYLMNPRLLMVAPSEQEQQ